MCQTNLNVKVGVWEELAKKRFDGFDPVVQILNVPDIQLSLRTMGAQTLKDSPFWRAAFLSATDIRALDLLCQAARAPVPMHLCAVASNFLLPAIIASSLDFSFAGKNGSGSTILAFGVDVVELVFCGRHAG